MILMVVIHPAAQAYGPPADGTSRAISSPKGSVLTAGILAYRYDWLIRLPRRTGYTWLAVGGALAAVLS
jgi:hypothetical protein